MYWSLENLSRASSVKREEMGQYKSNMYTLKTENGAEIKIWGSTVLDSLIEKVTMAVKCALPTVVPYIKNARKTLEGLQGEVPGSRLFIAYLFN